MSYIFYLMNDKSLSIKSLLYLSKVLVKGYFDNVIEVKDQRKIKRSQYTFEESGPI